MKFSLHITRWVGKAGLTLSLMLAATLAPAQKVTFFHNDPSGTPVMATDMSGNVVWKETYRPYGERLNNPAAEANNAIGFAGKPYDPSTGLSYMGARYFDPVIGRFTGVDPAGFDPDNIHSFNRYVYANNNPYRYVDPDGHNPVDAIFLGYDLVKLGMAIYNGSGAGQAAADVAISAAAMAFVPVPGMGQVAKAMRAADHGVDAAKALGIVAKDGTAITGLTKHGVDRVIGDGAKRAGTKPEAILDAVKNPNKIKEGVDSAGRPFKIYTGENARVVINPETGKIISTNPLSREGAHLP